MKIILIKPRRAYTIAISRRYDFSMSKEYRAIKIMIFEDKRFIPNKRSQIVGPRKILIKVNSDSIASIIIMISII